jgi:hypothetical protein
LVKDGTTNYSVSIKDKFTTDVKDKCPIVSYSIVKVIERNSGELIPLTDCSNQFKPVSLEKSSVFISNKS